MDNRKIKTPIGGHEVELKPFITGGEFEELEDIFMKQNQDEANQAELYREARNKMLSMIVISIDGKTENVPEEIKNLHKTDYQEVIREVDKISSGADETKKKDK